DPSRRARARVEQYRSHELELLVARDQRVRDCWTPGCRHTGYAQQGAPLDLGLRPWVARAAAARVPRRGVLLSAGRLGEPRPQPGIAVSDRRAGAGAEEIRELRGRAGAGDEDRQGAGR